MNEGIGNAISTPEEGGELEAQIAAGYQIPGTVAELLAELLPVDLPEDFRTMSSGASEDTDQGDWPPL